MRGIRAAAARAPLAVDAVLAATLCAVLTRVTAALGPLAAPGFVWLVALHLPLVVRRRRPAAVFWVVTAAAFAAVSVGVSGPALLIVPALAGYTLARHRPRRVLWPVPAPVVAFVVGWVWHDGPLWDALALAAAFALALLFGVYLAELDERARRLAREREQADRLAVATERTRIAREMHDIVAHNLAVMVALADGAAAVTPGEPQRGVDMMRQSAMTGRQALTEVRRLVGLLRMSEEEDGWSPRPGLADLTALVDQVRAAGLAVTLTGTCGELAPGPSLAVYRIVQEALTNTLKHAGPDATAEVVLCRTGTTAEVVVTDTGTATAPVGVGHGLTGMTERAAPYGGHVVAGPNPTGGWRVHLVIEEAR